MLAPFCLLSNDAPIVGVMRGRGNESILIGGHELAFILGTSVSNHDGRAVFVGHDNSWRGQSTSVSVGMVGFERLLDHSSVEGCPRLEGVMGEGVGLRAALSAIHLCSGRASESDSYGLPVLDQDLGAGSDFGILEVGGTVLALFVKESLHFIDVGFSVVLESALLLTNLCFVQTAHHL